MTWNFVENLSIRTKLLLVVAIPLFTILLYTVERVSHQVDAYQSARDLKLIFDNGLTLRDLAYELQNERGLSAGYFRNRNEENRVRLKEQRKRTDDALQVHLDLSMAGDGSYLLGSDHDRFMDWVGRLQGVRGEVDAPVHGKDNFEYFSQLISEAFRHFRIIEARSTNAELIVLVGAYTQLLDFEEQAAKERGLLQGVFSSGRLSTEGFLRLSAYAPAQEKAYDEFFVIAPAKYRHMLDDLMDAPVVTQVENLRQAVLSKAERDDLLNTLQELVGYGGMIHDFKNYLLRGDEHYLRRFSLGMIRLQAVIERYRNLPNLSPSIIGHLDTIESTFLEYRDAIPLIKRLRSEGVPPHEIDSRIRISDPTSLAAFSQLRKGVGDLDTSTWWSAATRRIGLIRSVESEMRFDIESFIGRLIDDSRRATMTLVSVSIAVIAGTLLASLILIRRLVGRVKHLGETMDRMSRSGQLEQFKEAGGDDELGRMMDSFNRLVSEREQVEHRLREAKQQAEAGIAARNQFLATMSHEIRTPMNGVLGMAELLQESRLDEEQYEFVQVILGSGRNLLEVINSILDFSKLEEGLVYLEQVNFDMDQLIHGVMRLLSVGARKKGLDLVVDYPPGMPRHFLGDPGRIRQILVNLVGNAVKFTERGHVRIQVAIEQPEGSEARISLNIDDTGIGIDEAAMEHLFDSFTQADGSTTRLYGGTGLGLAICKQLVNLMGGEIGVESTLGSGSSFTVSLSLPQAHSPEPVPEPDLTGVPVLAADDKKAAECEAMAPFSAHALLAEDIIANQKVARVMLARMGITVDLAENGVEAVDAWKHNSYDLILMDCRMPVMDGYQATEAIRREEGEGQRIPIIAVTANATQEDWDLCREAGMDAIVTKPFQRADLEEALARWLERAESAQPVPSRVACQEMPIVSPALNPDKLEVLREGVGEDFPEVMEAIKADMDRILSDLESKDPVADGDEVIRLAHSLKSVSQNVGGMVLSNMAKGFEAAARKGPVGNLPDCVVKMQKEHQRLLEELDKFEAS